MDLPKIISTNLTTNFSVNGGSGSTFDNPIRIDFSDDHDYVKTEMDIIHAVSLLKNASYKILDKKLSRHNEKMYDIIKVCFTNPSQGKNVFRIETIHFDVSSFWGE